MGESLSDEASAEQQAEMLLARYGIFAREFLPREQTTTWTPLGRAFERMELRGEIRRGYFVEGLSGMQYALPDAARLMSTLHDRGSNSKEPVLVSACDPANPYGSGIPLTSIPGGAPSRTNGNYLAFLDGSPLLVLEKNGGRIRSEETPDVAAVRHVMCAFLGLLKLTDGLRPFQTIVIEQWNGLPPASSPWRDLLQDLGFRRDRDQHMSADRYST